MSVTIRKMTNEEFALFYRWSIENHAKELMEELHIPQEQATKDAITEVSGMLPEGLDTKQHHLMTITAEKEPVGFIWTVCEEADGQKQLFICDFAIWEMKRRNGYGTAALKLAEQHAAEWGCEKSVLFVSKENMAARSLYEKCGYRVLRPAGYGAYMAKQLL